MCPLPSAVFSNWFFMDCVYPMRACIIKINTRCEYHSYAVREHMLEGLALRATAACMRFLRHAASHLRPCCCRNSLARSIYHPLNRTIAMHSECLQAQRCCCLVMVYPSSAKRMYAKHSLIQVRVQPIASFDVLFRHASKENVQPNPSHEHTFAPILT